MLNELNCTTAQKQAQATTGSVLPTESIIIPVFNPENRAPSSLNVRKRFRFAKKSYFNSFSLKETLFWTSSSEWCLGQPTTTFLSSLAVHRHLLLTSSHLCSPHSILAALLPKQMFIFRVLFCAPVGNTILIALIITLIRSVFYLSPVPRCSTPVQHPHKPTPLLEAPPALFGRGVQLTSYGHLCHYAL